MANKGPVENCVLCAFSGSKPTYNAHRMNLNGGHVFYCPAMQQISDIHLDHFLFKMYIRNLGISAIKDFSIEEIICNNSWVSIE